MGETELMLVLGSTSEIAWTTVQRLAQDKRQHWRFFLTGRNLAAVKQQAQQLAVATKQEVFFGYFDAMDDLTQHERLWRCVVPTLVVDAAHQQADDRQSPACTPVLYSVLPDGRVQAAAAPSVSDRAGPLGAVFCAVGYLGQREQVQDLAADAEHERVWRCNYSGLLPLLNRAAMYFEQRGYGRLLVISSVAGERGRCSNFFYGAAKAAMTAYLSGLRVRLLHSHREWLRQQSHALGGNHSHSNRQRMQVLTILPGYVRTKMVSGRKLPPLITATPEQVAADIVRAMERGQNVLYTIWMWRYIMLVTRHIPECVFKRLYMF